MAHSSLILTLVGPCRSDCWLNRKGSFIHVPDMFQTRGLIPGDGKGARVPEATGPSHFGADKGRGSWGIHGFTGLRFQFLFLLIWSVMLEGRGGKGGQKQPLHEAHYIDDMGIWRSAGWEWLICIF